MTPMLRSLALSLLIAGPEQRTLPREMFSLVADAIAESEHAPVIIAGFGRYGQIVGRLARRRTADGGVR